MHEKEYLLLHRRVSTYLHVASYTLSKLLVRHCSADYSAQYLKLKLTLYDESTTGYNYTLNISDVCYVLAILTLCNVTQCNANSVLFRNGQNNPTLLTKELGYDRDDSFSKLQYNKWFLTRYIKIFTQCRKCFDVTSSTTYSWHARNNYN